MPEPARPPKVAIVTLGCGRNEVDSENAAGLLTASGYEMVDDAEQADAIIVNTCAFISAAKKESIDTVFSAIALKSPPAARELHPDSSAEAAKRESTDPVLEAAGLKEHGRARTVLVMGCLAERYADTLRAELPEADAIVPFADYTRLAELLGSTLGGGAPAPGTAAATPMPGAPAPDRPAVTPTPTPTPAALAPAAPAPDRPAVTPAPAPGSRLPALAPAPAPPAPGGAVRPALVPPAGRRVLPMVFPTPAGAPFPARSRARQPVALVKLAEGCDRDCSFCAIPSFRGRFRSRRPTEVVDEVVWLAGQGVSEVVLVAENSTSYGKDLGGRSALVHLLRALATVEGLRRVRLQYLQPDELTPGLLEEMAANPVVCSYFDLSLQHASAPVLRRMRRGGSRPDFLDLVGRVRALDPDAAFRSNFILGFPGERRQDVRELEDFLEEARLDWVAFFAYSAEDGTAALALDGRVPTRTARARVERLSELQARVLDRVQAAWVGRRLEVMVDRVDADGTAEARSFREAPEHDGLVRVEGLASATAGDYVEVEVTGAEGPELRARPAWGAGAAPAPAPAARRVGPAVPATR
jgi:MiaB/RimO family radical SAM methylthiotransferase